MTSTRPGRHRLRLATRASPLAVWQAEHVAEGLRRAHPGLEVVLVRTDTLPDRRLDVPLSVLGGKGAFATEVQALVLAGDADAAVHSAKDLPAVTDEGLLLAALPERGDPRDALVGAALDDLAEGATVATGSRRRRAQLAALRPDLHFVELRGNMATRIAAVGTTREDRRVDAVVVAAVALERLGLGDRISEVLDPDAVVPQVGQGALAVEVRAEDAATTELVEALEHHPTRRAVRAERAFLAELGGDCELPAGAHAEQPAVGAPLRLRAVLTDDGGGVHVEEGSDVDGPTLGVSLARTLRARVHEADERLAAEASEADERAAEEAEERAWGPGPWAPEA